MKCSSFIDKGCILEYTTGSNVRKYSLFLVGFCGLSLFVLCSFSVRSRLVGFGCRFFRVFFWVFLGSSRLQVPVTAQFCARYHSRKFGFHFKVSINPFRENFILKCGLSVDTAHCFLMPGMVGG